MSPAHSSYDDVPYDSRVLSFTHPASLAAIGVLHGLEPEPVERCRVLELGCATAGNLASMATTLPEASFVGVDASERQVAIGMEQLKTLGLHNVELHAMDIRNIDKSFGQFDFIICHGVYTWVPPDVAARILEVCARHLAPQGIAFVSYNIYPGWHLSAMLREMMLYHVRNVSDPPQRVKEARSFLHALADSVRDEERLYKDLLKREAEELDRQLDYYVFHEYLEDVNTPVYFHEFAARAGDQGLQYLGSAGFSAWEQALAPHVNEALRSLPRLVREQYLDFIGNRGFRRSLLCHAGLMLAPNPLPESIQHLYVTGEARPVNPQPDLESDAAEEFRTATDAKLTTNNPLVKTVLSILADEYPRAMSFHDIRNRVCDRLRLGRDADATRSDVCTVLLRCALANLIELRTAPTPCVLAVSDRPTASSLARLHAKTGNLIPNLRHRLVRVEDMDRMVLQQLDGAHDRRAIQRIVAEVVSRGEFDLQDSGGNAVRNSATIAEAVEQFVEPCLHRLRSMAFLSA